MYENAKSIRQKLQPVNPRKVETIKIEVEKMLKVGFIDPTALIDWVSNVVLVDKKQGMICVCIDFSDLKKSCLKGNYPTLFIDQIVNESTGNEMLSFMDGFDAYNQISIHPKD